MNTAIVRPFMLSTRRVFEKMLECPCRVGKPTVSRGLGAEDGTVRAVIKISGSHQGYMVLNLPSTMASVIASLLGAPKEMDTAAQNVWAGDRIATLVKTLVRRLSQSIKMEFAVVAGADGSFERSVLRKQGAWLEVPMVGRFGKFTFALCVKPTQMIPPTPNEVALAG